MGAINSLHMATLRELDDPLSNQINAAADASPIESRASTDGDPIPRSLLLKTSLTPTDYAEAWALTHYLAQQHGDGFCQIPQGHEPGSTARAAHAPGESGRVSPVFRRRSCKARQEARRPHPQAQPERGAMTHCRTTP